MKLQLIYPDLPFWRAETSRLALFIGGIKFEDIRPSREEISKMRNKGIFPFSANARGKTTGDTVGNIKLLSHKENDKVLAVHIIGAHAGEIIGEAVAAIEAGLTAEDIALICHAHPTLSESMKEAASLSSIGKTLHF